MSNIVLITGGLGYIGGRIARHLAEKTDYNLRITTRKQFASPDWLKKGEIVQLDLLSEQDIQRACDGVQFVIHLAALNEIESGLDPEKALAVNCIGTLNLLKMAEKNGIERFIYFSTAHIYGSPLEGIITEKSLPRPVHPYAITHRTAEDFVLAAHDRRIFHGIVLRLSNSFGAPINAEVDRWSLVVNDLCRQAVAGKKLVLKSGGLQKRDFIPLSDVCRAVEHFLELTPSAFDNGLFNLGGECTLRIIDMAEKIAERCSSVLGFTPEIVRPISQDPAGSSQLGYNIDKLKATGFRLAGHFNDEIDSTLQLCQLNFS